MATFREFLEAAGMPAAEVDDLEARIQSALDDERRVNPHVPSLRDQAVQAGAPADEVDEACVTDHRLRYTNAYTIMKVWRPTARIFAALAKMHLESRQDPWASAQ